MKKLVVALLFLSFLFIFPACSEDDSPSETENQSEFVGDWGVNYESYSGMSLVEKINVYLTIEREEEGVLYGTGSVEYINNGTNTTQLTVEGSVTGSYNPSNSNSLYIAIAAGTASVPEFTFTGNWENQGENFKGTVTIYSGNQFYTLNDQSFYKRGN